MRRFTKRPNESETVTLKKVKILFITKLVEQFYTMLLAFTTFNPHPGNSPWGGDLRLAPRRVASGWRVCTYPWGPILEH